MATPYAIRVSPLDTGLLRPAQTQAAADKLSALLQDDLETHHVFFNASGFHNHIVHHLLALYGTGAGPAVLQTAYDDNKTYQVATRPPDDGVVRQLQADWKAHAPAYLGKGKHYPDFLRFFQAEMERLGWQHVVRAFVFGGDERCEDLFPRLFAGILHPLIHLMYGIEWQQPAIVAEALAQTAVHGAGNPVGGFLAEVERAANERAADGYDYELPRLYEGARQNTKLATCARWDDANLLHDGVMGRGRHEAVQLLSLVTVKPGELDERTVEMVHSAAFVAASAAWHPPHVAKYDFFLIHELNASLMFPTINKQSWIPAAVKTRFLEWKIRSDLAQYVARRCPPLSVHAIKKYAPLADTSPVAAPEDLLPRFHQVRDDGHTIKAVRALLVARRLSEEHKESRWIRISGDDVWINALYMLLDGSDTKLGTRKNWVRSAGFEEAWKDVPMLQ